jgi:hypothetical protein
VRAILKASPPPDQVDAAYRSLIQLDRMISRITGAQMWNRLTTTLAASVGTVNDAWNAEDDGSIGPDGETKLGRAIKSSVLPLSIFRSSL